MSNIDLDEILNAWTTYLQTITNWQDLVSGLTPKQTGCGPVYELSNPIDRPNESFAIADMREVKIAEPHYHPAETEIYFVLQGSGLAVVGGDEQLIEKGSVVVTLPNTTHFTVPSGGLVLAVINTPPFTPENYVVITKTNHNLGFNEEQLKRLSTM